MCSRPGPAWSALVRRSARRRKDTGSRYTRPYVRGLASIREVSGQHFDAVVVGAGPGGLTCASKLLDLGLRRVCMVDPSFTAGRIHERYREVPSNTKAGLFVQWATGTEAFSEAVQRAPARDGGGGGGGGDAFAKLKALNPDETCSLSDAVDVARLVSDGMRQDRRVHSIVGKVDSLAKRGSVWTLPHSRISADRVVLAPGAHPRGPPAFFAKYAHLKTLDLDTALRPSLLRTVLPDRSRVAVIGSSHSAVLALKNLYELGDNHASIVNFYRSPLLYAIYKDGWILYDNTGLKGVAATWAKQVLEADPLPDNVRRVNLKEDTRTEDQIYDAELKDCTHLLGAIGFDTNQLPQIDVDGRLVSPEFDPITGKFRVSKGDSDLLGGLYGAGIAFPERVTDPEGNVERAVGWFKFMKFLRRVGPQWVEQNA